MPKCLKAETFDPFRFVFNNADSFLPGGRFYECSRIQVVDFVELQKSVQVLKFLVSYLEPLAWQRVDDIVGHFGIFRY